MSTQYPSKWAARAAVLRLASLMGLVMATLVACGGGDEASNAAIQAPTNVTVAAPQSTPSAGNTSSGTSQTGSLQYLVYGSANVAAGLGANATAAITTATIEDTAIVFPSAGPFATGLSITKTLTVTPKWQGVVDGGGFPIPNGGIPNNPFPSGSGGGLLTQGNFFVFCSAGRAPTAVAEQVARMGAQVAMSGNFAPMTNVAALYGKTFRHFDCASTTVSTVFGDNKGHLTMSFDGVTLTEAETVQAFSAAGFTPATGAGAGQTFKRRAYSITINGTTRYAIVALDNRVYPYASVLYQME